jgi:HD-GYP domain-containing protein (c-di-GMP phosphodiesterase class II)
MLRVPITHAKVGMELALPVYLPRASARLLLRPGAQLEKSTIERLIELRLPEVWIKYPNMEMIAKFVSPQIQSSRAEVVSQVADAFDLAGKDMHARMDFPSYQQAMSTLMARLIEDPDAALFIGEIADAGSPAIRHGANVGFLAMLMGLRLDFYLLKERKRLSPRLAKDVTSLGVAAMLHDIGMTRLKASVLERWSTHHDHTDPEWREHVRIGYDLVRGFVEPSAASAVLNHHQRYDGSGFPTHTRNGEEIGLSGSQIHIFARILIVADLYDRLVHPAYTIGDAEETRKSRPPVYALNRMMHEPYRSWLDPIVLQSLITVCPAYAPGSQIRLSDGRPCVVIDWDARDPCRPVVREMTHFEDPDQGELIDLREQRDLTVVECDGYKVEEFNFYPDHKHAFDLRMIEKSMSNGVYELDPEVINLCKTEGDPGTEADQSASGDEDGQQHAA